MLGGNDASRSGRTAAEEEAAAAALPAQSCRGARRQRAEGGARGEPEPQRYGGPAGSRRLLRSSPGQSGAWRAPCGSETCPWRSSQRLGRRAGDPGRGPSPVAKLGLPAARVGFSGFGEIPLVGAQSFKAQRNNSVAHSELRRVSTCREGLKTPGTRNCCPRTVPSDQPGEDSLLGKVS